MDTSDLFTPAKLGPITLRNRFIKCATFEGMAQDNLVSDRLIDFHRAFSAGGVGMSTLAYLAVSPEGQGAPAEIVLTDDAVPGLRRLSDAIHGEGAAAAAQIGHAGPVAAGSGQAGLSPSRVFSPMALKFTRAANDSDLDRVTEQFANGARRVQEAGFDAIEIHMGHGYLLSSFLSPMLNRRDDRWGGSLENRARLVRQVANAVRAAVGPAIAVTAKFNMSDGVPKGLWLDESIQVARMLESDGSLDALELTAGSSFQNTMYMFRGDPPLTEMAAIMPKSIRLGFKLVGRKFFPKYPFEEAYLLPYARQFRDALDMPLILLGGVNRSDTAVQALEEGFEFVAMGRALLREPDLINKFAAGTSAESLCVHCNKCIPTIYVGSHCVLVPPGQRPGFAGLGPS